MRRIIILALAALAVPVSGTTGPLTQDACPGATAATVWAEPGGVLENLLFAEGDLWVSAGGQLLRFDGDGTERSDGLTTRIANAGGLVQDVGGLTDPAKPGWVYAGSGNSLANAITKTPAASVLRFDPADPNGTVQTFAAGFNMPNGMTQDASGTIYISNDFDYGLNKITPDGMWSEFSHVWGTNGLVISPDGSTMYAAVTFDGRSPIARIPVHNPEAAEPAAFQLSFSVLSLEPNVYPTQNDPSAPLLGVKGLDDMTRDADGILYVVANGMGELIRVDPASGHACLITSGLQNPSSVRIAPEDGDFADKNPTTTDLYISEFSGAIKRVIYSG